MFRPNALSLTDGYKPGHKPMLAPDTTRLYGTFIPRSLKYAPKGITKIVSAGQQYAWRWIHDQFHANFFYTEERNTMVLSYQKDRKVKLREKAMLFVERLSEYYGVPYEGKHFADLWDLGYLPIKVKALPEGIETLPNIPHQTFINTIDGYAWLPLYLETIISNASWKISTSTTIALQFRRVVEHWVDKTDRDRKYLIPFLCHDFSARGLDQEAMISSGLGHTFVFRGSDTVVVMYAMEYYYNSSSMMINSVNATEHSVTCTNIFYYDKELREGGRNQDIIRYYSYDLPADGSVEKPDYLAIAEWLTLERWLDDFPEGIFSYVCDTFDTWKSITHIVARLKEKIMKRNGKLVVRPDSGDPVDIICGDLSRWRYESEEGEEETEILPFEKGVIKLLWEIFGGTVNEQGYKVLDEHIGAIYGDSIDLNRQTEIYSRLEVSSFASGNIVLGIGLVKWLLY